MDFSPLILAVTEKTPLSMELRIPLSVMNFLEFAIWGAWWTVLGQYLEGLNFTRKQIGRVYATMAIGLDGHAAVRGLAGRHGLRRRATAGVSHLVGAALLLALAKIHKAEDVLLGGIALRVHLFADDSAGQRSGLHECPRPAISR